MVEVGLLIGGRTAMKPLRRVRAAAADELVEEHAHWPKMGTGSTWMMVVQVALGEKGKLDRSMLGLCHHPRIDETLLRRLRSSAV